MCLYVYIYIYIFTVYTYTDTQTQVRNYPNSLLQLLYWCRQKCDNCGTNWRGGGGGGAWAPKWHQLLAGRFITWLCSTMPHAVRIVPSSHFVTNMLSDMEWNVRPKSFNIIYEIIRVIIDLAMHGSIIILEMFGQFSLVKTCSLFEVLVHHLSTVLQVIVHQWWRRK